MAMAPLPHFERDATWGGGLYHAVKNGCKSEQGRGNIFFTRKFNSAIGPRKAFLKNRLSQHKMGAHTIRGRNKDSSWQTRRVRSQRLDKRIQDKPATDRQSECCVCDDKEASEFWAQRAQ